MYILPDNSNLISCLQMLAHLNYHFIVAKDKHINVKTLKLFKCDDICKV